MSEIVQSSVQLTACEEKTRRLVRNGRQPGTQLSLSVDRSFLRVALTRKPERGKLKNLYCVKSVARKRLVETVIH
jgi:hypothetical protein